MEVALDIESKNMAECRDENVAPAECAEEVVGDEVVFEGGGLRCAWSEGCLVDTEHSHFLVFFTGSFTSSIFAIIITRPSDLSVLCRVLAVEVCSVSDLRLNSSASYYMLPHAYLSQQPTGAFPLR